MEIINELTAIGRVLQQKRDQFLAPLGLKGIHGRILLEIGEHPGISQEGLVKYIKVDKSNIARHVAALEQKGFVRRLPGETDRRSVNLFLTSQTEYLLPRLQKAMHGWESELLRDLSRWEISQLRGLLTRILESAGEEN